MLLAGPGVAKAQTSPRLRTEALSVARAALAWLWRMVTCAAEVWAAMNDADHVECWALVDGLLFRE